MKVVQLMLENSLQNAKMIFASQSSAIKKSHLIGNESSYYSCLSHGEAAKLLTSFLKLRQACCHPQVGSSGLRSLQQTPMTMEEILQDLIEKAKTEGESLQRIIYNMQTISKSKTGRGKDM